MSPSLRSFVKCLFLLRRDVNVTVRGEVPASFTEPCGLAHGRRDLNEQEHFGNSQLEQIGELSKEDPIEVP